MALSGSFYKSIGSGYRLQIEWSATQNISGNTSTITAKLYLISLSSAYYINSSATDRQAKITISGDTNSPYPTPTAQLSGNQKKLLATHSYTTGHNADGTKSVGISGSYDLGGIRLSGTDYGTVSTSATVTLNTIPRKSTLTSEMSWRPPRAFPISISRASTSFTHDVKFYVKRKSSTGYTYIKTWSDVGASAGGGFTVTEMKLVYTTLAQDAGGDFRVILETFNGSSSLGSNTYDGNLAVEYSSKLDSTGQANWNVGQDVGISIARNHWDYTHVAKFYVNDMSNPIHTSPTIEYSYTWTPTAGEKTAMYDQMKNSNTATTKIELITYYNGIQVDIVKSATGTATVVDSNPTFGTGYTYADTNTTTTTITGSNQYIIQNKSTVLVTLPVASRALPVNSATMKTYTATLAGKSVTANWSSTANVTFDFGTINATTDQTLSVKAIDSRGNSTTTTKKVTIVPYSPPVVNATVKRLNGFEQSTTITISGSYAPITVANVIKNALASTSQYRFKADDSSTWGVWKNFSTASGTAPNYAYPNATELLDNTKSYTFEIKTTDKLATTTVTKTVAKGLPIFFVDSELNAVGVNTFPTVANTFQVNGEVDATSFKTVKLKNPNNPTAEFYFDWKSDRARMRIGGTGTGSVNGFQIQGTGDAVLLDVKNNQDVIVKRLETGTSIYNTAGGGLDMNNSDIIGANGIWFNDTADSDTEAINFLKSTGSIGSTSSADYDSIRAKDGSLYFNGVDIYNCVVPPTAPSMQNAWENYFALAYMKTHHGMVHFRGMIRNGAINTTAFLLPSGCRPTTSNQVFYCGMANGNHCRVDINMDGTVVVASVSGGNTFNNDWISLNGISFPTI